MPKKRQGKFKRKFKEYAPMRRGMYPVGSARKKTLPSYMLSNTLVTPDRVYTKLKTVIGETISSTTAPGVVLYRGNSPYDPKYAVGGLSACGFAQWASLYNRYRVIGSKITVSFRDNQISEDWNVGYVIPKVTTTLDTNFTLASCEPYAKVKYIPTKAAGYSCTISAYMSVKKMFGLVRGSYDRDFTSSVSGNPTREFYWHVGVDAVTGGVSQNVNCVVSIIYYVMFYDRVSLDA